MSPLGRKLNNPDLIIPKNARKMFLKIPVFIAIITLCAPSLEGQQTRENKNQDTIFVRKELFGSFFYINGRKLNTSVLEWLMHEVPQAEIKIQNAIMLDHLTAASYGFGGLLMISGLSTINENNNLSPKLIKSGGVFLGAGMLFQIFHARLKREAVFIYNTEILKKNGASHTGLQLRLSENSFGIAVVF